MDARREESGGSSFASLLRRFRKAVGFSQFFLAETSGISVETVGALERGLRKAPYAETIEAIADALKLNPADRAALKDAAARGRARRSVDPAAATSTAPERSLPAMYLIVEAGRVAEFAELAAHGSILFTLVPLSESRLGLLLSASDVGHDSDSLRTG